ncbi:helix-turn-helix domain-containing protein [Arenimonas daejeonensis]|uniref:helix-turn-helix domain-containing protein n=1 Tax=Arenimonas daejeonensis TaxID=370777 RepID=UPI0013153DA8|nr:hypothetical protein [Arenimonas daejeonensis]
MSAIDPLGTWKDWEQGHRDPAGPAKALLQVIRKDPTPGLSAPSDERRSRASGQC